MKRCPKCLQSKPLPEFNRNKTTRDGLAVYCRACVREINQAYFKPRGTDPVRKLAGMPLQTRFAAQYAPEPNTGCWLWFGAAYHNGYGGINVGGRRELAHRTSWLMHCGPIPEGMYVCHRCDTPACVNPAHLFLGTPTDNVQDMHAKGRWNRLSKVTPQQVKEIRRRRAAGETLQSLADAFGISDGNVSAICLGKSWKRLLTSEVLTA